ncbi:MAG TPA: glycosyltransferase [Ferruginibacter sp.]|nr:glycosyltransferase [Ferruginibacter sp.]
MIINSDIIIVGQQAWDIEIGSNCKNIALEFSKHNRVLYVNPPLDRISLFRNRHDAKVEKRLKVIKGKNSGLVQIQDKLWNLYPDCMIESINWMKFDTLYDLLNKVNNKRLAASIQKASDTLQLKNVIIFNDGDMFRSFYLNDLLKNQLSIYYSRDYLLATDYYKYHGQKLEPLLIKKSSLCVANSTYLTEYCKKYNPHSFYVGQGCDQLFSANIDQDQVPADIKNIQGPIIGYVGVLYTARLDIEILSLIAATNPDWQLVLIGPEDEAFKESDLHQQKNVHFLGSKPPELLADYINAFDVCINPQIVNQLTIGNYPRKVDEYLSIGKPVVATKTVAMEIFKDVVSLAQSKEEYPGLITKILNEETPEKKNQRRAFAATHTWENSVNEIYKAINMVAQKTDT